MSRKLLTFGIAFILIAAIAFNMQTAYSSPTFNSQQLSALPISSTNSTSSIPPDTYSQTSNVKSQQAFWSFLCQVAGINTNNYNVTRFHIIDSKVAGSQKVQTSVSAILSNNKENLSIAMALIDGKVRFYDLNLINGSLSGTQLTAIESLNAARNAINNYQVNFDASYCNGYGQLIPQAIQTDNTTINSENTILTVQTPKSLHDQIKYTELCWYNKISNISIAAQSIQATVAETGILTYFADNIGIYKVATTNITVTKGNALDIAMAFINQYAKENSRTITSMDAKLSYVADINGTRGDSFLLYPQWEVSAKFENDSTSHGVFGYAVLIWADSGKVQYSDTQAALQSIDENTLQSQNYVVIAIMAVSSAFVCTLVLINQKEKKRLFKLCGIIFVVALCSSLLAVQPARAAPSTIFGSTSDLSEDERNLDSDITDQISQWSTNVGYTTYNWYGSDTTASNMYIGAYDHGDLGSTVFYFGHGGHDHPGVWWWGWPPYFEKDRVAILADNGDHVQDIDIYDNSVSQSEGHHKVVFMWACEAGDTIGGWNTYPDESTEAHGMPFAWLHTNSLSSDGYYYPDYSGQAFIGWSGYGPQLHVEINGQSQAAYWFIYYFYQGALIGGYNLNGALDYAAQVLWQVNFKDCAFTAGEWTDGDGTYQGSMVVYGQGTMYIGDEQWVSDITDYRWGYTPASGVFNPYSLVGGENDGQFAQIYAGNYGDYAFIIGYMNAQASGDIHLWANTGSGYYSHLVVYVSNDCYNWDQKFNDYIYNSNPSDIYCGYSSGFRYIGICVYDDSGLSANMFIDAVHVTGF